MCLTAFKKTQGYKHVLGLQKRAGENAPVVKDLLAGSLRAGLEELFTINQPGLPKALRRCLGSTNVIEYPYSGVREKTGHVKRWRDDQ